jgi:peptidoglycan/LPS O-acetylase OafA/YrhL
MPTLSLTYIRPFDGIRAGAVLLVMLSHWPAPYGQWPVGWVGVQVFFVLSGFLITRLLEADRARPLAAFLRRFYWRRTLRIFPLYYFYLLLLGGGLLALATTTAGAASGGVLKHAATVRTDGPWLLTYLYNWQELIHWVDGRTGSEESRLWGHLWSLSVEEQFYLAFPLVVWTLPPAQLRRLLLLIVVGSPIGRVMAGEMLRHVPASPTTWAHFLSRATLFHLDSLALGGLLALGAGQALRSPGRWLMSALLVGAAWNLAVAAGLHTFTGHPWPSWKWLGYEHPSQLYQATQTAPLCLGVAWALLPSLVNTQAALLLLWAMRPTSATHWLSGRLVRYLGRISYGLYVWHMPLTLLALTKPAQKWLLASWQKELCGLLCFVIASVALASLSYYGFERRFLRLKERVR